MKKIGILFVFTLSINIVFAQSNFVITSPTAEAVINGNYNPQDFQQSNAVDNPQTIFSGINNNIDPQKLRSYIEQLEAFGTRHSSSDTLSSTRGIGATRKWVHQEFEIMRNNSEQRLIPFYFQFDRFICGVERHRNICAILPGTQTEDKSIVIVEAHVDSRCEGDCDIDCPAPGAEDNASGTALVMELARVMSQFSFEHTIVFMATIGEEQGLYGAEAFSTYCQNEGIPIKAVFNNDIVGGIICGETSSPPSCPFEGAIDSTQVRLFSAPGNARQLSRWIKLQYKEELLDIVEVPMMLSLMSQEDRTGRGGDHIPFRQKGYAAMRFTSANENGDVSVNDPDYHDHQHTSDDVLGFDTDGDGTLDSLFVDFNYLSRNTAINGVSIAAAATGPATPTFTFVEEDTELFWSVDDPLNLNHYRIASRSTALDFDTVYNFVGVTEGRIPRVINSNVDQRVCGAGVDADGVESLFSNLINFFPIFVSTEEVEDTQPNAFLLANVPNPFRDATLMQYHLSSLNGFTNVDLLITDVTGKEVDRINGTQNLGVNSFQYYTKDSMKGVYFYSLVIDGHLVDTKRMFVLP